jgi:quercetin dioxygenase-like cupin family protein
MTDWKATPLSPIIAKSDDAPAYWMQGCLWTVLASGDQTAGQYSLIEQLMPGEVGPPPHVHDRQVEVFYILDGQMRLQLGTDIAEAGPGSLISVPPGTPHGFKVLSDTARVLNLYVPAALDTQIVTLGSPATARTLPPPGAETPPSGEQLAEFLNEIKAQASQGWVDIENLLGQPKPAM